MKNLHVYESEWVTVEAEITVQYPSVELCELAVQMLAEMNISDREKAERLQRLIKNNTLIWHNN